MPNTLNIRNDGQAHLGPLNIDSMSPSELDEVIAHPAVHLDVKNYAKLTKEARALRLDGNVAKAMRLEAKAQRVYEQDIPRRCRW